MPLSLRRYKSYILRLPYRALPGLLRNDKPILKKAIYDPNVVFLALWVMIFHGY